MTASTRRRVSGDTSARPLMTFETVGTETPASAATRAIVGRSEERRFASVTVEVIAAVYRKFRSASQRFVAVASPKRLLTVPWRVLRFGAKVVVHRTETFVRRSSPIRRTGVQDRQRRMPNRTCAAPTEEECRNDRRASHVKPKANAGIARGSRTDDQCLFQWRCGKCRSRERRGTERRGTERRRLDGSVGGRRRARDRRLVAHHHR